MIAAFTRRIDSNGKAKRRDKDRIKEMQLLHLSMAEKIQNPPVNEIGKVEAHNED